MPEIPRFSIIANSHKDSGIQVYFFKLTYRWVN